MVTTEKILQTMNSLQSGEVIAVRRKKCSGASSHPTVGTVLDIDNVCSQIMMVTFCFLAMILSCFMILF